jgi:tripartite-type tricarboxylate transporter receptor subunit TctC
MFRLLFFCLSGVLLAAPVSAQLSPKWPERPIRFIVPFQPGSSSDTVARIIGQKLGERLGQQLVVENRVGASGNLGTEAVARADPDGYTIGLANTSTHVIAASLSSSLGYDPIKDFAPVTALVTLPTILVVHPDVQAKTPDEFIALAKKQPGKMSFGSAGAGSIHHLTFAIFAERTGIELLHVPYRGGSAMVNGLLTGEIQAGWSGIPNVIELIAAGKLRGLCVSTLQRSPSTPQIATCDELGIKGFNVATMMGLHAPAGTSPKIIARLQAETAKAMREPAMATRMTQLGMVMEENGTANYAAFMKQDLARYEQAVKKLDIQGAK